MPFLFHTGLETADMNVHPLDINLFAGAGGLALGLREAGFSPGLLYEIDQYASQTLRDNQVPVNPPIDDGVREADIRKTNWQEKVQELGLPVRLLAAGVPCQPFSLAGKHLAERDGRNLFPELFTAINHLDPQAVLIENVRGLVRTSFSPYFSYILRRLEFPSLLPRDGEYWQDHDTRLQLHKKSPGVQPDYDVAWQLLNAADYGVPQNRTRVFIVATRSDLSSDYCFPSPTHSRAALERVQHTGEYWHRHEIPPRRASAPGGVLDLTDERYAPWVTVRDAITDLPQPAGAEHNATMNHWQILGARPYPGHTGSCPDWPSKTIKAGVHGVPGGENTLVIDRERIRYYTLRETARIQTFPDRHVFSGARLHVTRQIGNAVPRLLAEAVAAPLFDILTSDPH